MRLIDADALFKTFEEHGWYNNADRDEIAERLLLEQPTIDAVPVRRGKWEPVSDGVKGGHFECCVCKHPAFYAEDGVEELTMFCPNCGADMRGESS